MVLIPMVSIIIPHFNRSALLRKTIESVKKQDYNYWEIIIVDDYSTEDEYKIVETYLCAAIKLYKNTNVLKGASACRNIGLTKAIGDYIIFLDSDDLLEDFCLNQRMKVLKENNLLDWAVFPQYSLKENLENNIIMFSKPIKTRESAIQYFLQLDPPWQTMASIWKKKVIIDLGGFDEKLIFMEDPDIHLRALLTYDLRVSIEFDLPPDSFYRLSKIPETQVENFYKNSIKYRFDFLYKTVKYLSQSEPISINYRLYLRLGYINFIKTFLLARLKNYGNEFTLMNAFLKDENILKKTDIFKFKIIKKIFMSNSFVIDLLRLKGLFYKVL